MAGLKSFKGALSQLYGEQRAQVKGIKERSLVNKAKNEAKRELEEAQSDQPVHFLRIDGRAARLVKNDAQFYAQQQNEGLVPWAAHPDVLIDRYDVRSLLDIYIEPDPRVLAHRQRSTKELELEEQLRFEAYRDLVRLKCLGLSERQGIAHAEQENVAIRAASRAAAVAALEAAKGPKPLPSQGALFAGASGANAVPAGTGQFAAVGYSYGGEAGGGGEEEEEEDEEDSDDDDVPATAEDVDMDRAAFREFGLDEFSSMLRWAMRQEAEEAAAVRRKKRYTGWGRKKASIRAKRLTGQGLDPAEFAKRPPAHYGGAAALQPGGADISWIPERKPEDLAQRFDRRGSPEYDGEDGCRRSRSPGRRPRAEFITSFGGGSSDKAPGYGQAPRQQQEQRQEGGGVRDALPGAADPALEGPHMLPAAAMKLHGVRPEEQRGRDRYGSVSGRDYSKAKSAAAAPTVVKAVDRSKETPQERLKRLMAAQLNKKIQSDSITAAQKKQQEEAERRARLANEAAAQEAEWRDRERERSRRRSRSRSREREPRRCSRSRDRGDRYGHGERDSRRRSRSRSRERQNRSSRRSPSPYRGSRR